MLEWGIRDLDWTVESPSPRLCSSGPPFSDSSAAGDFAARPSLDEWLRQRLAGGERHGSNRARATPPPPGGGGAPARTGGAIKAVATVGMVADLVRNVGGDHVEVTQIMGAGVDPHLYKATRDDVRTIATGDIVFYSGLMLEENGRHPRQGGPDQAGRRRHRNLEPATLLEPEDFAGAL